MKTDREKNLKLAYDISKREYLRTVKARETVRADLTVCYFSCLLFAVLILAGMDIFKSQFLLLPFVILSIASTISGFVLVVFRKTDTPHYTEEFLDYCEEHTTNKVYKREVEVLIDCTMDKLLAAEEARSILKFCYALKVIGNLIFLIYILYIVLKDIIGI